MVAKSSNESKTFDLLVEIFILTFLLFRVTTNGLNGIYKTYADSGNPAKPHDGSFLCSKREK